MTVDDSIAAMCSRIQQLFNVGEEEAENLLGFLVVNLKEISEELPDSAAEAEVPWHEVPFLARCLRAVGHNCGVAALEEYAQRLETTVPEQDLDLLVQVGEDLRGFLSVSGF